MHWEKPSKQLVDTFDAAIGAYPLAERRLMFGMPAAKEKKARASKAKK
jgi:hypothetical protein